MVARRNLITTLFIAIFFFGIFSLVFLEYLNTRLDSIYYQENVKPNSNSNFRNSVSNAEKNTSNLQEKPVSESQPLSSNSNRPELTVEERFAKKGIDYEKISIEGDASKEEVIANLKKIVNKVDIEDYNQSRDLFIKFFVLVDSNGNEVGRAVIRPDKTYAIYYKKNLIEEGRVR